MDLKYVQCPYCLKPFQENDDVVVCPDCGKIHEVPINFTREG